MKKRGELIIVGKLEAAVIEIESVKAPPVLEARYRITAGEAVKEDFQRNAKGTQTGEEFAVRYKDNLKVEIHDIWVVLCGYKADIETRMIEEAPMSVLHAENIFQALDELPETKAVITFSGLAPNDAVIARSRSYRYMKNAQRAIVGDLYNVNPEYVIMLPDLQLI